MELKGYGYDYCLIYFLILVFFLIYWGFVIGENFGLGMVYLGLVM